MDVRPLTPPSVCRSLCHVREAGAGHKAVQAEQRMKEGCGETIASVLWKKERLGTRSLMYVPPGEPVSAQARIIYIYRPRPLV